MAILRLTGDRQRTQCAAVKRVIEREDLELLRADLIAMRSHHLERAFHGLGPAIGEERSLQATDFRQALGQGSLIAVVIKIRGVNQQPGLFGNYLEDARVCMPE